MSDPAALFAAAPVAVLATVSGEGQPHVVPVVFAVSGDRLYTAVDAKRKSTQHLRRLDNIAVNPRVSLLVIAEPDDTTPPQALPRVALQADAAVLPREALQGHASMAQLALVPLADDWAVRHFRICTRNDGSTTAAISSTNAALAGVVSGDSVSVSAGAGVVINVNTAKKVQIAPVSVTP